LKIFILVNLDQKIMTIQLPSSLRFIERDWLSANHVVAFDANMATVIDTGYDKHKQLTKALVAGALGRCKLGRIVNTHLHSDHCGGNAILQATHGCEIWVPELSWQDALNWDEAALTHKDTAQTCDRFTPTGLIKPGDKLQFGGLEWDAIAAPGHDPKSLIFFAASEGILISADALWGNGFGVLFPELDGQSGVTEQTQTLDFIEQLEPRIVIPGHGPMFADVPQAIARARSRLQAFGNDRAKHAKNGIKVLMKFLLLDREIVEIAALPALLNDAAIMRQSSKLLGLPALEAVTQAYLDLIKVGQLHLSEDGKFLLN
jgi:glyoxylase-like metal-dependent hydrolase (beta-lactamase superfamily II)